MEINDIVHPCASNYSTKGCADDVDDKDAPPMSMSSSKDDVVLPNENEEPQLFNSNKETPFFLKEKQRAFPLRRF